MLLQTIVVDLTPVVPGGNNGGAKIFAIELIRRLSELAPQTQFVLLTHAISHEEMAQLDRTNVKRQMVAGQSAGTSKGRTAVPIFSRIATHVPIRALSLVARLGYRVNVALKRRGSNKLLSRLKADLLFCPFTAPTYSDSRVPTVCTIYDLQYKTYPEFFSAADVANRDQTFLDACARATVLAAISEYSRQSAIRYGGLESGRIRTVYLRIAGRLTAQAHPVASVLRRLGLTPGRYLIYPANFWKHKNHEMLLTSFGIACADARFNQDVRLVCTGAPGERRDLIVAAAKAMLLDDRICFPGYLPDDELSALVHNSGGLIFPSLYEGFGLPVIEAMASGIPVACSNTTSLPEVAAGAAILFDPRVPSEIAEAMINLISDLKRRETLIATGHRRADDFADTDLMAREYWEIFQYASTQLAANITC